MSLLFNSICYSLNFIIYMMYVDHIYSPPDITPNSYPILFPYQFHAIFYYVLFLFLYL